MSLAIIPISPDLGGSNRLEKAFRDAYLGTRSKAFPFRANDAWNSVSPELKANYAKAVDQFFSDLGLMKVHGADALMLVTNKRYEQDPKTKEIVASPDKGMTSALYRWMTRNEQHLPDEEVEQLRGILTALEELEQTAQA